MKVWLLIIAVLDILVLAWVVVSLLINHVIYRVDPHGPNSFDCRQLSLAWSSLFKRLGLKVQFVKSEFDDDGLRRDASPEGPYHIWLKITSWGIPFESTLALPFLHPDVIRRFRPGSPPLIDDQVVPREEVERLCDLPYFKKKKVPKLGTFEDGVTR